MLYVINYTNEKYEVQRKYNTQTAYSKGKCDKVIEYRPQDIGDFIKEHASVFAYQRGAGLWLWKPYIIQQTLQLLKPGDYLLYCDAGAFFVNNIEYLIRTMEKYSQSMMTFELPLLERQFTKRETFHLMGISEYSMNQRLTGYILLKKDAFSVAFINEWLQEMLDERKLSYKKFLPEIDEFPDFFQHRDDQSVFSLLCYKHRLPAFRDPSQFGDRPWMYARNEYSYHPKTYGNSSYPKIIVSNRDQPPLKYRYFEKLQSILQKAGLFDQNFYFRKHHITPKEIII